MACPALVGCWIRIGVLRYKAGRFINPPQRELAMKPWSACRFMAVGNMASFVLSHCSPAMAQLAPPVIQQMQPAAPAPGTIQLVQAPVVAVSQVQIPGPSAVGIAYNVIYEYGGHQYSVQLPQDPGAYLTLQIPAPSPTLIAPAVVTGIAVQSVYVNPVPSYIYRPYSYIRPARVIYRPAVYFPGGHQHRHSGHGHRH